MFNKNTEYALVILSELKKAKEAGKKVISLELACTPSAIKIGFAEQISRKLKDAELVAAFRGPGGGYAITEKGLNINLWELIEAVEDSLENKISKLLPSSKLLHQECADKIKSVYIFR